MDDSRDKKPSTDDSESAADIIRGKLNRIYSDEPDATQEIKEVKSIKKAHHRLSKHQKFMDDLSKSGRSLAEIQTAWHDYYQNLSDQEKHQVWHEFYSSHEASKKLENKHQQNGGNAFASVSKQRQNRTHSQAQSSASSTYPKNKPENPKEDLLNKVAKRSARSKKSAHAHSLLFGLGLGTVVMFLMMFTFFNERFITPFIRPSVNVSATPIIVDPNDSGPISAEPKIIIPKINVEAPVVYDEESTDEKAIQNALERGVVHYPITPEPGQKGNAVIVGHSSSNILNSGKYKFAFLLLKSLEDGDTFIVHKDKVRYVYKVYNKFVTDPKDISVLNPPDDDRESIMTLITCDPPGLSTNRLIIQAEQIFPNPEKNKEPSVSATTDGSESPEQLPSDAPTLWSRIVNAIFN